MAALPTDAVAVPLRQIDPATHPFEAPSRQLRGEEDIAQWLKSEAASMLMDYVQTLNHAVTGHTLREACLTTPLIDRLTQVHAEIASWTDDFPPHTQGQRFGNTAFREWMARLEERTPALLASLLPSSHHRAIPELAGYWLGAFGNKTRIDYGTGTRLAPRPHIFGMLNPACLPPAPSAKGHELSYLAFMCCLSLLGLVDASAMQAMVTRVFSSYLATARKLQLRYGLEPAGSHGVWGLDDYQFLPFLWGSAQLIHHDSLRPASVLSRATVDAAADDYLYMAAIQFIYRVKRGNFFEHSPILHDITALPTWAKVNAGLHKMYVGEVLGKFPVIQHFPLGSLLRLAPADNPNDLLKR